jgi:two-component system nitrate/nitrite response regulator NarL
MKILLCDDHVLLAEALEALLKIAGHEVLVTAQPQEAVAVAAEESPDVCVLDLGFPDGDGLDLLRAVRETVPAAKIVVLSGQREPDLVRAAIDLGARGYLCKDVGVVDVVRAVDQVLDGELVIDPLVAQSLTQRRRHRSDDIEWLISFLTQREREVLRRIVTGQSTEEMARDMAVTRSTARTHVQNVLQKLGVHSRLQAVAAVAGRQPVETPPAGRS